MKKIKKNTIDKLIKFNIKMNILSRGNQYSIETFEKH